MTPIRLTGLDPTARALAETTLAWTDRWFDDDVGLLWNPPGSFTPDLADRSVHVVPTSAWYAIGLLARHLPGDADRAVRILHAIAALQYDEPGTAWHGTFARFREWPHPPAAAVEWVDYDPNWRQFVGTALSLILRDHGPELPRATVERLRAVRRRAVHGEPLGRIDPGYTNIALMHAWLLAEVGIDDDDAGVVARGEALADAVVAVFDEHGAFAEHNSPTYYGIDLFALALWARRSPTARFRTAGARLEAALWRDLAARYHPGLGELAGPYSRSYGMSMHRYVAAVAVWIAVHLGLDAAPLPPLGDVVAHGHDLPLAPVAALLGTVVPDDAADRLRRLTEPRLVATTLPGATSRLASTWLAPGIAIGAASCSAGWSAHRQYHPATVHWAGPAGTAWLRLVHAGPADADLAPGRLRIRCRPHLRRGWSPPTLVVGGLAGNHVPDPSTRTRPAGIDATWTLPGLAVGLRTTAVAVRLDRDDDGSVRVVLDADAASAELDVELELGPAPA